MPRLREPCPFDNKVGANGGRGGGNAPRTLGGSGCPGVAPHHSFGWSSPPRLGQYRGLHHPAPVQLGASRRYSSSRPAVTVGEISLHATALRAVPFRQQSWRKRRPGRRERPADPWRVALVAPVRLPTTTSAEAASPAWAISGVAPPGTRAVGVSRRHSPSPPAREDSAEADLFKLLIHELTTGYVVRQHRETDYQGNFIKQRPQKSASTSTTMKSAFADDKQYELTELGKQFVHYAMNEIVPQLGGGTGGSAQATQNQGPPGESTSA